MSQVLAPEFFAFLGVDIFVAMSLLTCLLDRHFPTTLPYVLQAAAVAGYVHLWISREFIALFGSYMRFWYSFLYLAVALAIVIALNMYLAIIKRQWTLAKAFSATVAFPSMLISAFFVSVYTVQIVELYLVQIAMFASVLVLGVSFAVLLRTKILTIGRGGEKE